MTDKCSCKDPAVVRLFEKLSRWVGLSESCAPALAAFYREKYTTNAALCSDEVCKATGYSRANAGIIISQLESLGVVVGQRDLTQKGRGRKRVLYTVNSGLDELFTLGVKSMADRMYAILRDIKTLESDNAEGNESMTNMLTDLRGQIETNLKVFSKATSTDCLQE